MARANPVHITLLFDSLLLNPRVEIRTNIYIWLCCNTGLCHVKNKKLFLCSVLHTQLKS